MKGITVTIIEKDKKPREVQYEINENTLSIPELGYSYFFGSDTREILMRDKVIYYNEYSVVNLTQPKLNQKVIRYIEVISVQPRFNV